MRGAGAVLLAAALTGLALAAFGSAPRHRPGMVRLSDSGPAFLGYDGTPDLAPRGRDWPVSLVFAGRASVGTVKAALARVGFTRPGELRFLAYQTPNASLRFDGDHGLKTACDANGTDVHVRIYAPTATDRFEDPDLGDFVVATAHLDRADGCAGGPRLFGFSEAAEARLAQLIRRRLGWRVDANRIPLGNQEPYRRDIADSAHVWWSDGRATLVQVP